MSKDRHTSVPLQTNSRDHEQCKKHLFHLGLSGENRGQIVNAGPRVTTENCECLLSTCTKGIPEPQPSTVLHKERMNYNWVQDMSHPHGRVNCPFSATRSNKQLPKSTRSIQLDQEFFEPKTEIGWLLLILVALAMLVELITLWISLFVSLTLRNLSEQRKWHGLNFTSKDVRNPKN